MMNAAIDIGSNTVRLLIGEFRDGHLEPLLYKRQITRLAGGMSTENNLSQESMHRTLMALVDFSKTVADHRVGQIRVVGTAALRKAVNRQNFVEAASDQAGLLVEVITGEEEARLMALGALSVLQPLPERAIIIDIGGGSTEVVCCDGVSVFFQASYPLGVVRLSEEFSDVKMRRAQIDRVVSDCIRSLERTLSMPLSNCQLIGTAGTMTTLAAVDLRMAQYDPAHINNHVLSLDSLRDRVESFSRMSVHERELIAGMEPGRGDLILPGLDIVIAFMNATSQQTIKVADSGLMEGVLIDLDRRI